MGLKRITPQPSLAQMVSGQIRDAIMTGALRLGENISEDRLVTQFGVSRSPIRDAMAMLSNEGLVVVRPKRGSFVFETSLEDISQICDYRQLLEGQAVRAALKFDAEAYLNAMQSILEKMDTAMASAEHQAYSLLDNDFHRLAFDHCGNSYLREAYARVSGRISALRSNVTAPYSERRSESLFEHHQIHDHLCNAALDDFDAALEVHIQRTRQVYSAALADGHLGKN